MLDVDNFKYINDTYGHKIGDTILINLAQALQTHSRKTDIVCRYGGEEFIILLPNTNIHGAKSLADKIRAHIEECSLDINKETKVKFTVSVGVSQVDADKEKNFESAIKRADDALYEAKETGKNKVCLGEA
jgi:diguanylate cyclase (GGDEF)-like protein